jgi:Ca2+-binding RTX toxin-like protein
VPADGSQGSPGVTYGYSAIAKAAVAAIHNVTQSADSMEAYGFLTKTMVLAKGAQGFYHDPTWNIAPKLSDGSYLSFKNITVTSSTGSQTLAGGDANELIHGSKGADLVSGGKGVDILFGDDGNDRLSGGLGDDLLYGGKGNDRLSGDQGNDMLRGNSGSDTFVFDHNAGGRDKVDDFTIGTDLLEIKQNLNGNGLLTGSQVLSTATSDADGNAVLHLGGGADIVLLGLTTSMLNKDMIVMV